MMPKRAQKQTITGLMIDDDDRVQPSKWQRYISLSRTKLHHGARRHVCAHISCNQTHIIYVRIYVRIYNTFLFIYIYV